MMWMKKILARWVGDAMQMDSNVDEDWNLPKSEVDTSIDLNDPMHITIYNATGGKIIKFTSYDSDHMGSKESVYLIHAEDNFEEVLTQFITIEMMKHGK